MCDAYFKEIIDPSDLKAVQWVAGSRLREGVQLFCLTSRHDPSPSAPGQTLHHKHAEDDTSRGV